MTYVLYERSQYAAFDCPSKTNVMIITPGKSVIRGDLKISKADVKVRRPNRDKRKTEENNHGAVIAGCSAKGETLYWD